MIDISEAKRTPSQCPVCEWSNTGLLNYGTPDKSDWRCHGCAARAIQRSSTIARSTEARVREEIAAYLKEIGLPWCSEVADEILKGAYRASDKGGGDADG